MAQKLHIEKIAAERQQTIDNMAVSIKRREDRLAYLNTEVERLRALIG
jgi:hypothetical protein